jgi:hypothetical protein
MHVVLQYPILQALLQSKSRWLLSQVQSVFIVCFGSKKLSLLHNFKRNFSLCRKEPPSRPIIYSWHRNFVETGCSVCHAKSPDRPCVSEATVEQLRESFLQKSTRHASWETDILNVTLRSMNYPSFNTLQMQIRWFVRNSVCRCFIGYKTMRDLWIPYFSVMRASFMLVVRSVPTSAGFEAAKIHVSS